MATSDSALNPGYMDFVSSVVAVSMITAFLLLFWPTQCLVFVESQLKNGQLPWMLMGLTLIAGVSACFISERSFWAVAGEAFFSVLLCRVLLQGLIGSIVYLS
jgi:hypothetical protein